MDGARGPGSSRSGAAATGSRQRRRRPRSGARGPAKGAMDTTGLRGGHGHEGRRLSRACGARARAAARGRAGLVASARGGRCWRGSRPWRTSTGQPSTRASTSTAGPGRRSCGARMKTQRSPGSVSLSRDGGERVDLRAVGVAHGHDVERGRGSAPGGSPPRARAGPPPRRCRGSAGPRCAKARIGS